MYLCAELSRFHCIKAFKCSSWYFHNWQGFGEADVEAAPKKKEKKLSVDDDVENSAPADDGEILPEMSDDENDENIRDSQRE